MNQQDNQASWLDEVVKMLPAEEGKKFIQYWHRVHRHHPNNDELLPILQLLEYITLFCIKSVAALGQAVLELGRLRQQITQSSHHLDTKVGEILRTTVEVRAVASEAAAAAEMAANSRLPYWTLFFWHCIDGFVIGGLVLLGFVYLRQGLPATPKAATEYQDLINRYDKTIDQQSTIIYQQKVQIDALAKKVDELQR